MALELSVIIAALNEAASLPTLLQQLRAQRGVRLEVIVCDGGSSDATVATAEACGVRVARTTRGRARQMNAGAAVAQGTYLLFLHADSRVEAPALLADALAALVGAADPTGELVAGHFPLRFSGYPPQAEGFYRYLEGKTALNRRYSINGDQGMLMAAESFRALGGFDERLPFLEDQRFAERLWQQGRWLVLPGRLTTSARRFETEGRTERYTLMALIMAMHAAGVDEFFSQAAVYAAQHETTRLRLAPYLCLIRQILWARRWQGTLSTLFRVGGFVRENAWQLFYWRDLRNGAGDRLPRLAFHDRWLSRRLCNPPCDALAALLACLWFFVWLPLQPADAG